MFRRIGVVEFLLAPVLVLAVVGIGMLNFEEHQQQQASAARSGAVRTVLFQGVQHA